MVELQSRLPVLGRRPPLVPHSVKVALPQRHHSRASLGYRQHVPGSADSP
eukprot:CAMPEP_0114266308 /NCGR_PEP_ID=MMETSP0058-20121206/24538_1 /TAXON_ID=36894 /ORGANISM="Pyramimonas parkeae, CCMP726" /LENGTH=49 /DNA_ID= /DNA_START= /DNA_END= /DNA_ORIENTATION=